MFKCNICNKEFNSKEKLGGHKSSHSRLGRKRKDCSHVTNFCLSCGKPTTNKKFCSLKCNSSTNKNKHLNSKVKIRNQQLDITYRQLNEYRKNHNVCEICKKSCQTGRKLAVDHNHKNNKFRGLLCFNCNVMIERIETSGIQNIINYLNK